MTRDERSHFTTDPTFMLLRGVWKTGTTACGKRREVAYITDELDLVSCGGCRMAGIAYLQEQVALITDLLAYHDAGELKGGSRAVKLWADFIPKLREELAEYQAMIERCVF